MFTHSAFSQYCVCLIASYCSNIIVLPPIVKSAYKTDRSAVRD